MPPVALTSKTVWTLGPGEHRDAKVPGLVFRVRTYRRKRGGEITSRTFSVVYTLGGKNRRMTLGALSEEFSLENARTLAREKLHQFRVGGDPVEERRRALLQADLTVGRLVLERLDAARLKASTAKEWRRIAEADIIGRPGRLTRLGQMPATAVRRADVRTWLQGFSSGWAANHAFEVLRWAYARALEIELVEHSPCTGVRKPHRGESSERVLSTPEVRALWQALGEAGEGPAEDAVRLLLFTGVRRAMVLGARLGEFSDALGAAISPEPRLAPPSRTALGGSGVRPEPAWTIPGGFAGRSKSGRSHVVPLSPQAAAVVRRRLEQAPGEYLFPTVGIRRLGQVPSPYMLALPSARVLSLKMGTRLALWRLQADPAEIGPQLAHMERWKLHGLRHTLATHMREDLGVSRNVVALILGHTQTGGGGATKVYDRAEMLPERRAALALWGAWVEGLAAERSNVLPMRKG